MGPLANNEHQELATRLGAVLLTALGWAGEAQVYVGVNVSDRAVDWQVNYGAPDVAVVMPGSNARDCQTHLCGGPDLVVEIVSPGDRSHDKLPFYADIGVREALLIERAPWALERYELEGGRLIPKARSSVQQSDLLESRVVLVAFRLLAGEPRPLLEVVHRDGAQRWLV